MLEYQLKQLIKSRPEIKLVTNRGLETEDRKVVFYAEDFEVITLVDKKDGNLYVIDGHHRLSSILLGNPNKFTFEIWSKPNA